MYTTSARHYEDGLLIIVEDDKFLFKANAINEAFDWGETGMNPCNISVRGPGGRFVKWKK